MSDAGDVEDEVASIIGAMIGRRDNFGKPRRVGEAARRRPQRDDRRCALGAPDSG